jgi:type VI protein secretion system component VasF
MYSTIFRMAWPYLGRYAAERAAAYLQARKERLEQVAEEQVEKLEAKKEALPVPAGPPQPLAGSSTWLVMASMSLLAVVGFVLYRVFMQPEESN